MCQRKNRWLEHLWGLCYTCFCMNLQGNPVRDSYRLSCKWGNFTMASFQTMQPFAVPIWSRYWADFVPIQLSTIFLQLLRRKGRHKRTQDEWKKFHESSIVRVLNPYRAAWNRMKGAEFCSPRWSPSTKKHWFYAFYKPGLADLTPHWHQTCRKGFTKIAESYPLTGMALCFLVQLCISIHSMEKVLSPSVKFPHKLTQAAYRWYNL